MSSTNKTANYQLSQFVGTDIPSILNDYNGDMRKIDNAIKEVANAEGSSQSDIAGLQATVGQHTTEISGINSTVNAVSGRIVAIESKIPASASEDNPLITNEDIATNARIVEIGEELTNVNDDVKDIKLCIPANASASNKLVTALDVAGNILVESFTINVGENFADFAYRIGAKIKELVDSGVSPYSLGVYQRYPSNSRMHRMNDYDNSSAVFESTASGQNYEPSTLYIPTVVAEKNNATWKNTIFEFNNGSFDPSETPTAVTVTGYEVIHDVTYTHSSGTIQFDLYII